MLGDGNGGQQTSFRLPQTAGSQAGLGRWLDWLIPKNPCRCMSVSVKPTNIMGRRQTFPINLSKRSGRVSARRLFKRRFISGCAMVSAPRRRTYFRRYLNRNCEDGRGNGGNSPDVLGCTATYDVPVAYRFVRIVNSKGSLLERHPSFCCVSGSQISKNYNPVPIARGTIQIWL